MKKMVIVIGAAFAACMAALADVSFEVKNVEAHPRFPWNGKVDIDFTIQSSDANADFKVTTECTDHAGNTNIAMRAVKYNDTGSAAANFTLKPGTHRLVWDADVDMPNRRLESVSFAVFANLIGATDTAEYLVIDLSGGPSASNYPVTTRTGVPSGGWTDEYKSTKLVMRRCSAGSFVHTGWHGDNVTLTKDFYAGVFEVTQKQWYQVMGSSPFYYRGTGDTYPVYRVSYDMIRGSSSGANWPSSSSVDATSFLGKLRDKTGLSELDLPTDAQWEYACRAGTTTTYNTGDSESALASAGWYSGNSGSTTHPVGQKTANAWGLYDMHGNVWEWCLDWSGESLSGSDPVGAASGPYRYYRGGSWSHDASDATSSYANCYYPSYEDTEHGFRLFRTVP